MISDYVPILPSPFPIIESIVNTNRFTLLDWDALEDAIWLHLGQNGECLEIDG